MSKELDDIAMERDHAKYEASVYQHKVERLENRVRYQRSAKDRKRTHRLIQYGVVFECHHRELSELTDEEIYSLVESILEIPGVDRKIQSSVAGHRKEGD